MNNCKIAYHTDAGIKKRTNQDSLLVRGIQNRQGETVFAVICDGMGGMEKGELASATMIREYADWFIERYAGTDTVWTLAEIRDQWQEILELTNEKLIRYGEVRKIQLGTTATCILIFPDRRYLSCHIGDTRIYRVRSRMEQLTEDHTLVAREVKRGVMTAKQAAKDGRKNVLLQCIGINHSLRPQFLEGELRAGEAVLLCSDGFRHVVTEKEIFRRLHRIAWDEAAMKQALVELVELNKLRQEADNISAVLIKLR